MDELINSIISPLPVTYIKSEVRFVVVKFVTCSEDEVKLDIWEFVEVKFVDDKFITLILSNMLFSNAILNNVDTEAAAPDITLAVPF